MGFCSKIKSNEVDSYEKRDFCRRFNNAILLIAIRLGFRGKQLYEFLFLRRCGAGTENKLYGKRLQFQQLKPDYAQY